MEFELRPVNGELAIVANDRDGVDGVIFVTVEDDRITVAARHPESREARRRLSHRTTPSFRFLRGPSAGLGLLSTPGQRTAAAAATTSTRP